MNENEYKSMRSQLMPVPCAFEKSILALKTYCTESTQKNLAEREIVTCSNAKNAERCAVWLRHLREESQFSLQMPKGSSVLPHAKEMKVQVGGVRGLQKVLELTPEGEIGTDIVQTLEAGAEKFPGFEAVPFEEIVREIVKFKLRG